MSLFKAWSEDKLNKKFVVTENFAELVSKGERFCFPWRVGDLTLFEALTGGAFDLLNWQHSGEFDQNFSKKSNAQGFARGGGVGRMGGFGIDRYITHELIMYFSQKRKVSFSGNLRVQGEQGIFTGCSKFLSEKLWRVMQCGNL